MKLTLNGQQVTAATGARDLDGEGPLVLLVHGAGMDRTVWHQQTRYLAHHGVRAAALDLPGHGTSDGPVLTSVDAMADWLLDVVGVIGGQAHLVGHSMGALTALHAAATDGSSGQGQISSLSLLGVGSAMPVHPVLLAAAQNNEPLADELVTAWGHGKRQHVGQNPTPGLWMLGGGIALLDAAKDDVLATDLVACNAYKSALDVAPNVTCPTLVIAGDSDRMTPARSGQSVAEQIAGAQFVKLTDTGHTMMLERPAEVRALLLAHLLDD